jgi:hypothetical protein
VRKNAAKKQDGRKTRWIKHRAEKTAAARNNGRAVATIEPRQVTTLRDMQALHQQMVETLERIRSTELQAVEREPVPVQMAYNFYRLTRAMWGHA